MLLKEYTLVFAHGNVKVKLGVFKIVWPFDKTTFIPSPSQTIICFPAFGIDHELAHVLREGVHVQAQQVPGTCAQDYILPEITQPKGLPRKFKMNNGHNM